jgi:ABC-type phosphate/phosphonate transport system substrate-binding protein
MKRFGRSLVATLLAVMALPLLAQKWVVHLPSSPVESASRQAAALNRLADYLAKAAPGQGVEMQLFRRLADAESFLADKPAEVSLVLCDAAMLLDLPSDLTATHRLSRGGKTTYRRQVVVAAGRQELAKLADLRGKNLVVVESGGPSAALYLGRTVFGGLLEPKDYFAAVRPASDDVAALNEVLFSQADAALVAEFNPLLEAKLGKELKAIWTSGELSLPVLAQRGDPEGAPAKALAAALASLGAQPAGREILAELGIDGFVPIEGRERLALRRAPAPAAKRFELFPPPAPTKVVLPAPPAAADLPLTLDLGLPPRKSFAELIEALPAGTEAPVQKPGGR